MGESIKLAGPSIVTLIGIFPLGEFSKMECLA
jgi:hypothetical protein